MLLHWKWIFYHFVSNFTTLLICALAVFLWMPQLISAPEGLGPIILIITGIVVISAISAVVMGFHSARDLQKQLENISLGAKNLAYGNLNYRVRLTGSPDFDSIVLAFNEMATRLEDQVGALQKLAQENEQLIQETKIAAISEERQRLARDLHDAVSQQIFAISMLAATASKLVQGEPEQTRKLILEISQSANRAQSEMRALLLQLRPLTLQNESLPQALKSLALELEGKQTIKCNLDLDEIVLTKNIENQLFRIAQEALSNILRHSEATRVNIILRGSSASTRALLIIEDNGIGFNPEAATHSTIGLRSMKERATIIGGTVRWLSMPGQGTKVEVRVPLSAESLVARSD